MTGLFPIICSIGLIQPYFFFVFSCSDFFWLAHRIVTLFLESVLSLSVNIAKYGGTCVNPSIWEREAAGQEFEVLT